MRSTIRKRILGGQTTTCTHVQLDTCRCTCYHNTSSKGAPIMEPNSIAKRAVTPHSSKPHSYGAAANKEATRYAQT